MRRKEDEIRNSNLTKKIKLVITGLIIVYMLLSVIPKFKISLFDTTDIFIINKIIADIKNLTLALITSFSTILAVIITIESNNKQNSENLIIQRNNAYKQMNKTNGKLITEEIVKFYKNACYLLSLSNISTTLGINNIFDYEINKIKSNNTLFLKRLKEDFIYDNKVVNAIDKIDFNTSNDEYFNHSHALFSLFYGFSDRETKVVNSLECEKKAKLKLYELSYIDYFDNKEYYLRERILLWINDEITYSELLKKDESVQKLIFKQVRFFKEIVNCKNVEFEDFTASVASKKLENEYLVLQKLISGIILDDDKIGAYILCKNCYKYVNEENLYNGLGSNITKFEKLFLQKFILPYSEENRSINKVVHNIENYNYF